jgi:aryl-alcohol dehydrogenase-like predicted oxidoreductase
VNPTFLLGSALEELRQEGKIRMIGLSNVSLGQLRHAQTVPPQEAGSTSAIDCENVHRWPPMSSAVYCRSPYG